MIRPTIVLSAVLAGLAAPLLAQDSRIDEAEAAAARAEEAAADVLRAAQGLDAPMGIEPAASAPLEAEPAEIEPLYVEPAPAEPMARAPIDDAPALAIEWIAEPVIQPLDEAPGDGEEELAQGEGPEIDGEGLVFEDAAEEAEPAYDLVPPSGEPQLASAATLEGASSSAPPPPRRTTRRVRLGYSPEERAAWLAQCRTAYRGSYDCDGYLAHYEQAMSAVSGDRSVPARATVP